MPSLDRPDGVSIHWEEQGEGPLVVLANTYFNYPGLFPGLVADLARDHRVVEYDLRGQGRSTRAGPYELGVDVADLLALVEHLGPPAVVVPLGDGILRAVVAAAERPDLVPAVVSPAGTPVGRAALAGGEGLVASDAVVDGIIRMAGTDPRAALRSMISIANPQASEDEIRGRVERSLEYCPPDVLLTRARAWVEGDPIESAQKLGDRLWVLDPGTNPWFPPEQLKRVRELLPEAHIELVEDGAVTRPDIAAGVVRRLSGGT